MQSILQNISIINPAEPLYLFFFPSSWFFTTGNIKCQEKYHAIIQIIFYLVPV